jgi:hypothetical protein
MFTGKTMMAPIFFLRFHIKVQNIGTCHFVKGSSRESGSAPAHYLTTPLELIKKHFASTDNLNSLR